MASNSIDSALNETIQRSFETLMALQNQDGSWPGDTHGGADNTAIWFITQNLLMGKPHARIQEAFSEFKAVQQDDGSFLPYPGALSGSLRTTSIVYACMRMNGLTDTDEMAGASRKFIDDQGGFSKLDMQAQAYLGVAGVMPKQAFKAPTTLFRLMPGFDRFLGKRFAEFPAIAANSLPPTMVGISKGVEAFTSWRCPLRKLAAKGFIRYFRSHQNPSGDWGGVMEPTCWVLMALHYLGVSVSDPMIQRSLRRLNHWLYPTANGLQVLPFKAEVWNTALLTRAALFNGQSVTSDKIKRGVEYLISEQGLINEKLDWQNPQPGQPRFGGWAFQAGNPLGSDPDSSSAVLYTLGLIQNAYSQSSEQGWTALDRSIKVGKEWILGMQNPDGGWPSFTWGQKSKPPGPLYTQPMVAPEGLVEQMKYFLDPPLELVDPALEDETGRILNALIAIGIEPDEQPIRKAVTFLKNQVGSNGAWWGRWEVNYLTSTGYILNGLGDVGEKPETPFIQTAIDWVISKQNADGGWGETADSYFHPEKAGEGPSNPVVTGKVLTGLISIHRQDVSPVKSQIENGISYLLDNENNGWWHTDFAIGVVLPPEALYTNPIYSQYVALEALLTYRRFVSVNTVN